ncbi:uncharacterized protein FA14DRAFT_32565 [Meira miltonrushii]|uniref:Uncharacterized protein n=1 Tax=Meira miltonrushii TaxID=1280837 RepID=A0A316VAJ3_9BASI|nr:uncharacterized protein FA14DRAFT_32565 [Meira miltonrushii]PWN34649.1 hypothetical protein FA14DRAFT_32565 [Meira miltonrushii]
MRSSQLLFVIGTMFAFAATMTFSLPGLGQQIKGLVKGVPIKVPILGTATWYGQQSRGSCGWWSKDSDYVVALSHDLPYNKHCGKYVVVNYLGKHIRAKVSDTCMGCDPPHIDLSRGAFAKLSNGNYNLGKLDVLWKFDD